MTSCKQPPRAATSRSIGPTIQAILSYTSDQESPSNWIIIIQSLWIVSLKSNSAPRESNDSSRNERHVPRGGRSQIHSPGQSTQIEQDRELKQQAPPPIHTNEWIMSLWQTDIANGANPPAALNNWRLFVFGLVLDFNSISFLCFMLCSFIYLFILLSSLSRMAASGTRRAQWPDQFHPNGLWKPLRKLAQILLATLNMANQASHQSLLPEPG